MKSAYVVGIVTFYSQIEGINCRSQFFFLTKLQTWRLKPIVICDTQCIDCPSTRCRFMPWSEIKREIRSLISWFQTRPFRGVWSSIIKKVLFSRASTNRVSQLQSLGSYELQQGELYREGSERSVERIWRPSSPPGMWLSLHSTMNHGPPGSGPASWLLMAESLTF